MKRLLSVCVLALIGLSACESETGMSPTALEEGEAAFAKVELPAFEPPEICPTAGCLLEPTTFTRDNKKPLVRVFTFSAAEEQEAELVVYSSNPKTTTVKAWLNGETVLLPSALPRAKSTEVRVPLTLAAEDVLEIRLSGKPGTQVAFWIEEVVAEAAEPDGSDPGDDQEPPPPQPTMTFLLTAQSVDMSADMNAACEAARTGSVIADWNDVVEAMGSGLYVKDDILSTGYAYVLRDGMGTFGDFISTYHYVLSAFGPMLANEGAIGDDFALEGSTAPQQVLCVLK